MLIARRGKTTTFPLIVSNIYSRNTKALCRHVSKNSDSSEQNTGQGKRETRTPTFQKQFVDKVSKTLHNFPSKVRTKGQDVSENLLGTADSIKAQLQDRQARLTFKLATVQITCPNEKIAKTLSHGLVEKRLAACVNIIPNITSVYSWQGAIEEDSEVLMIVKTRQTSVSRVVEYVKKEHPYDVPEVISLGIQDGSYDYMKWVDSYMNGD